MWILPSIFLVKSSVHRDPRCFCPSPFLSTVHNIKYSFRPVDFGRAFRSWFAAPDVRGSCSRARSNQLGSVKQYLERRVTLLFEYLVSTSFPIDLVDYLVNQIAGFVFVNIPVDVDDAQWVAGTTEEQVTSVGVVVAAAEPLVVGEGVAAMVEVSALRILAIVVVASFAVMNNI